MQISTELSEHNADEDQSIDMDADFEEEDEDVEDVPPEIQTDSDRLSPRSTPPRPSSSQSGLKIKLRFPSYQTQSSKASTPISGDFQRVSYRDTAVDSEDQDEAQVNPAPGPSLSTRQLTVNTPPDSLLISRKKKQLNDAELALRREETARKRRNLSEKKLEDEKAETINRLLKKQSRQRSKRNVNREQPTPGAPGGLTPDPEGAENGEDRLELAVESVPQMYRWLSRVTSVDNEGKDIEEKRHVITFSVPTGVYALSPNLALPKREMPARSSSNQLCDFSGCEAVRKYRSVRNPQKGACSGQHLKALEV